MKVIKETDQYIVLDMGLMHYKPHSNEKRHSYLIKHKISGVVRMVSKDNFEKIVL